MALHETRAPYRPTLMTGKKVHQVFFPGNHGHLGWIEEKEGLVHAPLAWMIQQLQTYVGLEFDEEQLIARFPNYQRSSRAPNAVASSSGSDTLVPTMELQEDDSLLAIDPPKWYQGRILPYSSALLAVIGKHSRSPGYLSSIEDAREAQIHCGARLRGTVGGVEAVPGYTMGRSEDGVHWTRLMPPKLGWARSLSPAKTSGSRTSHHHKGAQDEGLKTSHSLVGCIYEAKVGALEAALLGISQ